MNAWWRSFRGNGGQPPQVATQSTTRASLYTPPAADMPSASVNGNGVAAPPEPPSFDDGDIGGIHAVTKKTDVWFEYQMHDVEQLAGHLAAEWASKGLPRHDVPRTEPLEPEQVLAKLCERTLGDWKQRVVTKMRDAVEDANRGLAEHVATLRGRIARLETMKHDLADREERIERIRTQLEQPMQPVKYGRIFPAWFFWVGAALLALVEFVANFPVFRLMLPMNARLAEVAGHAAENVDDTRLSAGPRMMLVELSTHLEAAVVALVAVIILVILGKTIGNGARALLALKADEHPLAATAIRSSQRQHRMLVQVSIAGVIAVLGFLYFARDGIANAARARVAATEAELATVRAAAAVQNRDPGAVLQTTRRIRDLDRRLAVQREDAAYATTVEQNNLPIAMLNVALVLAAVVLGFGYAKDDLTARVGEHPDIARLRQQCLDIRREQLLVNHDARAAAADAGLAIGTVQHLLSARPLRSWEGKVKRVESVIPRFRGENARLRGLDPASVRAFDVPPTLAIPLVNVEQHFEEPADFARLCEERRELVLALERLTPRRQDDAAEQEGSREDA